MLADLGYDGRRADPRPRPPGPVRPRPARRVAACAPARRARAGRGGRDRRALPARPAAQARSRRCCTTTRPGGWTSCAGPSRSAPSWAREAVSFWAGRTPAAASRRTSPGDRLVRRLRDGRAPRRPRRACRWASSPSRACSSRTSPAGGGCARRSARPPGFGLTLDIGHCRCLEPMPVAGVRAPRRRAPGQRADRRHAPGRARAPGVRRRARSTSRRCCARWPTPATAGWWRSSCPATRTPPRPSPPRSLDFLRAAALARR